MEKILIVDDSKTILNRLSLAIKEKLKIKVYTATSLKECADLILKEKAKFDLALLDYNLPDANEGEVVGVVNKFKIPSILLTGSILNKKNPVFNNQNLIDYVIKSGNNAIEYVLGVVKRFINNGRIEIMILDDSKTFAAKMESLCKSYNLNTIVCYEPLKALELVSQRPNLKLILVDYNMPKMDGIEFTTEIRKKYKKDEIAIIALSGISEKEVVSNFLKVGANDFIYKNFEIDEFIARVNNNLEVMELFEITQDKNKKDYLTPCFNKDYFFKTGEDIYQLSKKKKLLLATVLLDLDRFQTINESFGHEVGDELIKEIANILLDKLNKDSIVARLIADQFCILFKNRPYAETYQTFDEIRDLISKTTFEIQDYKINVTISIGISFDFGDSLEDMVESADEALSLAKYQGGNQIKVNS